MAYFNEFPNTRTYDSDLQWLIDSTQDVVDNMAGLTTDIDEKTNAAAKSADDAAKYANDAKNSFLTAQAQAELSNKYAQDALNSADIAATYSKIVLPRFHINFDSMELIQDTDAVGITFYLDTNKKLLYNIA